MKSRKNRRKNPPKLLPPHRERRVRFMSHATGLPLSDVIEWCAQQRKNKEKKKP